MKTLPELTASRYKKGKCPYLVVIKGRAACAACGQRIDGKNEPTAVVTTPTTWFRGDDRVAFYHQTCYDAGGK